MLGGIASWLTGLAALVAVGGSMPAAAQETLPTTIAAGAMEDLVAKAKAEGSVLVYGAPPQEKWARWSRLFEEEYGIPVQYYRAPTNQLYQRFVQEQKVGRHQADLLAISDLNVIMEAIDSGFIAEFTPANAGKFPDDLIVPARAYPLYVNTQAVGWNTRVVPEDLQKRLLEAPLEALLDPRLKGKIATVSVTAGGNQIATNANIVLNQAETYGWPYLEKLAAQDVAVMNSFPAVLDAVIAGDYWATPEAYRPGFGAPIVAGAPLAFASPRIAAATPFWLVVAEGAPHPYAARLFMEWATTREAQEQLAVIAEAEVGFEGWEDRREIVKQSWYRPVEELWYGAGRDPRLKGDGLKGFYERWNGIFKR